MPSDSAITRVRVYHRGATVTRAVQGVVEPVGTGGSRGSVVEVAGLPLALQDATVRVRSTTDGTVAGAVKVGLFAKAPEDIPEPPDETELRAVRRRIEAIDRSLQLIESEMKLLRELSVPKRPAGEEGKPPPASPMRARVALDQFTDEKIGERLEEARTLRRERVQKTEEAAALQDAVTRQRIARGVRPDAITKTVLVAVRGPDGDLEPGTKVSLELDYGVPGARWAPQYTCDIARDGSSARLQLRGLVTQASGEDWKGVQLELSTASPAMFTELPTLPSFRIGKVQPTPAAPGYRPPPSGADALYADYDRARAGATSMLPSRTRFVVPDLHVDPFGPPELQTLAPAAAAFEDDDTEMLDLDSFGAVGAADLSEAEEAPVPQAAPAPAPARPARSMAANRSAPRRRMKKRAKGGGGADELAASIATGDEGGIGGMDAEELVGAPSVAFDRLRLHPPASGHRGVLRPVDASEDYDRLLRRSGLAVTFDPMSVLSEAGRQAAAAGRLRLPPGAVDVGDSTGHFDYTYRSDDAVDVPSGATWNSVPLGLRMATCTVTYVVVPRVDTNVFRVASVTNPTEAPLLPGPVEVYVSGEYVLSSHLPLVGPNGRFKLGLGVEQSIRCVRNTRFEEQRSGSNVVAMAELHHHIAIELHNRLGRDVQIAVRERIPQPATDAEVDVAEVSIEPAWGEWDQREVGPKLLGGRQWEVEVPANGSLPLNAHYVVKIYANNEVVGGNRRES